MDGSHVVFLSTVGSRQGPVFRPGDELTTYVYGQLASQAGHHCDIFFYAHESYNVADFWLLESSRSFLTPRGNSGAANQ
ncbi:unnamed protein product, partial [Urochloa humidicola]